LGSKYNFKRTKHFRQKLGKVDTPFNEKLKNVKWGEFRIEDVLQWQKQKEIDPLKLEDLKDETEKTYPFYGQATINNGIISYNQLNKSVLNNHLGKPTILIHSNNQNIVFLETPFYLKDGHGATSVMQCPKLNSINQMFIIASIDRIIKNKYSYNNKATKIELKNTIISLPVKKDKIDFDFMESFILKLEAERISVFQSYLIANSFDNYTLTNKEQKAIKEFKDFKWEVFNLEKLFGKSTRGKRLKSADRTLGILPFVTAGETDEGVSAFIGNKVTEFSENTTTIDMFGSAKYRNYKYGGDDHIAVVHTDKLPKFASIFVTSAIHKSSYNGQFNYGRNFYAKDADVLSILLPVKDKKPNYETMETVISAIHKLVVKDVVLYVERKKKELNKMTENANT